MKLHLCLLPLFLSLMTGMANAELKMSAIFGDHMVMQREKPIHVWGWTAPGQSVTAQLADHETTTTAGDDGRFDLTLPEMEAGGPHQLTIQADETRVFKDVLIGEVWLCSGQSNMQWAVSQSNDADIEALTAKYPQLRLVTLPRVGTQEPKTTFDGQWQPCDPQVVRDFSAVGYYFGRQLHQTLDIPIGLIDNAWGGSSCEAWIRRDLLEQEPEFGPLMERWREKRP